MVYRPLFNFLQSQKASLQALDQCLQPCYAYNFKCRQRIFIHSTNYPLHRFHYPHRFLSLVGSISNLVGIKYRIILMTNNQVSVLGPLVIYIAEKSGFHFTSPRIEPKTPLVLDGHASGYKFTE